MAQQTRTTTKPKAEVEAPQPAPADNLPAPRARASVNAIVPHSWQEITSIAAAICRAGMQPKSYCKTDAYGKVVYVEGKPVPEPDKVAIAIMHGLEVGFPPMAALQSIAVINGMPSVYGDGLLALIRSSGLLHDIEETMEWDKEGPVAATCKMWRKGEKTPSIQTYAREDAMKAKLWGKQGPWTDHPHRMLQWRARGWCGRDKFADVLRGLHIVEEVQDMVDITPQGPAEPEPKREDFTDKGAGEQPKPTGQAATAKATATGDAPSNVAQPEKPKDPPPKKEEPKKAATDVQDLNETTDQPGDPRDREEQQEQPKPSAPTPIDKTDLGEDDPPPDDPAPIRFANYTKYSDFFQFADPWLCDISRTEAEITAFGQFYYEYMRRGCDPKVEPNPKVRAAMEDTKRVYQEALADAQKRAKQPR